MSVTGENILFSNRRKSLACLYDRVPYGKADSHLYFTSCVRGVVGFRHCSSKRSAAVTDCAARAPAARTLPSSAKARTLPCPFNRPGLINSEIHDGAIRNRTWHNLTQDCTFHTGRHQHLTPKFPSLRAVDEENRRTLAPVTPSGGDLGLGWLGLDLVKTMICTSRYGGGA